MTEQLWFSDVSNEIVDNNSAEEKELVEKINESLTDLQCEKLAADKLESMNNEQLAAFLTKNYFNWWAKSYSECKNSWEILNFSMKAALQILAKNNTKKYDNNWNETTDQDWKTATELIKTRWGIDLDNDNILIKVLQNIVWAHPDWKPGPQTIALVISALGGDISGIYEWVNTLYDKNEKLKVQNIDKFQIWWIDYKYDKNQITIWKEGEKIKITYKGNIKEVDTTKNPPVCEWFTFENGWIKKLNTNNNTSNWSTNSPENWNDGTASNNPKHDENPPMPKDWDKNIEVGTHCTEATSKFINNNNDKLSFTEANKLDYLSILDNILGDQKKSPTFYSFIKLDKKFWWNYRLTYDDLKNFDKNAGKNTWRGFDATWRWGVFHETKSENDDYLMYRDWKIIRHNEWSGHGNTFEVDGTHVGDDEKFNTVECFCKYIAGVPIERARKNVRNLAKENREITYRSEKIRPEVIDKTATLKSVWFWDTSDIWLKRKKTFISLLELPDNFWKWYKLSEKDINNFAAWMQNNIFDWWNSAVFHTEWVGKRWVNKNVPMFEVDWSSSGNHRSDRRFANVENFFYKLNIRVSTGKWHK